MIEICQGNLLEADSQALVNPVNCVGVMGKGLALQFKEAYRDNFLAYEKACCAGEVKPGRLFIVATNRATNPQYIINFPTKRHWKDKSRLEDIRLGLESLAKEVKRLELQSIAIPALGCGLGGLDWTDVEPLIRTSFANLPDVRISLFPPAN